MTAWCCRILRNDKSIIDKDTKAKATFNLAIAVLSLFSPMTKAHLTNT